MLVAAEATEMYRSAHVSGLSLYVEKTGYFADHNSETSCRIVENLAVECKMYQRFRSPIQAPVMEVQLIVGSVAANGDIRTGPFESMMHDDGQVRSRNSMRARV